jgi:hypothetical protein
MRIACGIESAYFKSLPRGGRTRLSNNPTGLQRVTYDLVCCNQKNATKRRRKVQASTRIETASFNAVVTISICPSDSSGNIGSETNWRAALSATGKVPVS